MMKTKLPQLTAALSAITVLFLAACQGDKPSDESPTANENTASDNAALEAFVVKKAHPDVQQISEVFKSPTPGTKVVIGGEIMGRMKPLVDGRAMVLLGDPTKITPCNRRPDDLCDTPWDVCCDLPEVIKGSIATVQFLDADGALIKAGLKDFKGIKELTYLTVSGTIAEGSNAENLLITASEFYIAEESPYRGAAPVSGHGHEHEEEAKAE